MTNSSNKAESLLRRLVKAVELARHTNICDLCYEDPCDLFCECPCHKRIEAAEEKVSQILAEAKEFIDA